MRFIFRSLLFALCIAVTLTAFIEPITRTPLRPYAINQDYATDYLLSVNIPSSISFDAYIEVEFPQPYQLSSPCTAYIKGPGSDFTTYPCTKEFITKYVVAVGTITAGEYYIAFEGIKNPAAYFGSSNFKIRTYQNQEVLVDSNEYLDAVPFLPYPETSNNATIENLGYTNVNLGSKFDFTFSLNVPLEKGDSIKFNFPMGFSFVKPACFHRNSGAYAIPEVLHNSRMVICHQWPEAMEANTWQVVSIIGVVNPEFSGFFKGFYLETLQGFSSYVYEQVKVKNPIHISPGSINVAVRSASLLMTTNTTHVFDLLFEDDVKSDAQIWIKLPPGFRYLTPNCSLLRAIEPQLNGEVTCGLAANKTGYIVEGFAKIPASQLVSVKVSVENPPVAVAYKVQIFSYSTSYNAQIDEAFTSITIQNNYGSSKFYKSHALHWTTRLGHSETGPLEFTFFLNIPLPATYSTFEGHLVVDIRPQIPTPPQGTLRCFFYNTVPAESCTWDVSDPTKTTLTIYTPTTETYYQSEIPITITTEDAVGTYGIRLPDLIQRYKFYFYFFRNGETVEHEVYFEDYVPDPIVMDSTWLTTGFYPTQYGEESYLEITWTNKYMDLGTNYFIELSFDHSNQAWDYNLGWGAQPWYGRYDMPCLVDGLGTDYSCILIPGGAANTQSIIQIIGLSAISSVSPNNVFTFRLPKIKFGTPSTAVSAYMTFTVYQNTPGENTNKIPIMYMINTYTPSAVSVVSTTAFTTLTVSPNQPDVDSTLTMVFNSVSNPEYTIFEYPSLFTIATQEDTCGSSNPCYIFSDPVRWIVFAPSPLQGSTVTASHTIHTAPYIGGYVFKAKTDLNQVIGNKISQTFTLNPGALTVTLITSTNDEINENSLVLFQVDFTTVTYLPDDSSVVLSFSSSAGLSVPTRDDFYCEVVSGLTGYSTVGVICERYTSRKIRLYNLATTAKNTAVTLKINMLTTTVTTLPLTVTTYYDRSATLEVDTGSTSLTITFLHDNFASSAIQNDRSGKIVRVSTYGGITFSLTPTNSYSGGTMYIYFDTGFTLSSTSNDVLYCKIGTYRRRCSLSATNPLTVRIPNLQGVDLVANTANTVFITTDYADNLIKGIKAPSTPGDKYIRIKLQDSLGNDMEQIGKYIYVYPASIPEFQVFPTTTTLSKETMYKFEFILKVALPSQTSTSTKGRILIEFPYNSENYLSDLGTGYTNVGANLGCVISGLTTSTSLGCRLINAASTNYPAQVEITGFDAITSVPTSTITVYLAKFLNPAQTLSEYTLNLKTESVVVSTGAVTPLEFTTYSFWNRVTAVPTSYATVHTSPVAPGFLSSPVPNQPGQWLYVSLYSNVDLSIGDYYVLEVPLSIVLASTLTCPSSCDLCLSFPNIGWVVYRLSSVITANTNYDGTIKTVTIPPYLTVTGYTITAYIWKDGELNHKMLHNVPGLGSSAIGTFSSYSIALVTSDQAVRARTNVEVKIQFTCQSKIPSTGSIEIRFPSDVTPQANCRNSISGGTALTSSTGRVACEIQTNSAGSSWVLTNFDAVAESTKIVIFGYVTLPDAVGNTGSFELYSYGNQDPDLATNGHPIDRMNSDTAYYLNIPNDYKTLTLDVNPTININSPMIAASTNYKPLMFDFTLYSTTVTSSNNIQITVDAPSGSSFGTGLETGAQLTCYFVNKGTGAITACSVTTSGTAPLVYSLVPQETLAASTSYRGVITTVFADSGNDGILQPSSAGIYRIGMAVLSASSAIVEADMDFYEVYPSQFSTLTVKNYIMSKGDEDIIDISLTVGTAIATAHRLIIELPVLYNSTNMFGTDLGSGLSDLDDKKCEVISSTPTITMSCYLQKGNIYAGTPSTIVVYGFSADFTALRFAFTAVNPSVTTSTALPITIYTLTGTGPFTKGYYQTVEKAIVVLDPTITATTISTQPTFNQYKTSTPTNSDGASSLTISIYFAGTLTANDYYVIKTHKLGTPATPKTGTLTIATDTAATYLTLPKNQFIVLKPSTSISSTTTSVTVPNLYNPDYGQGTGINTLNFYGYTTYFSTMASEKVTYTTEGSDFFLTAFTSNPTITLDGTNTATTRQQSLLSISFSTYFANIQSLIIVVPGELTLGNDCYDFTTAASNFVYVLQCTTDTTYNRMYITLEANTYSSGVAYSMVIKAPVTNSATAGSVSTFDFYAYTSVQTDPTTGVNRVYKVTGYDASLSLSAGSADVAPPTFIEAEYVPYVEYKDSFPAGSIGELRFQFELPTAVDSTGVFTIQLPSSTYLAFDTTNQNIGDITTKPAVIIYDSSLTSYSGNILILPTYSSDTLAFQLPSGVTLASGRTPVFKVTQVARQGDYIGLNVQSGISPQEVPLYMSLVQSSTTYLGLLGNLYVSLPDTSYAASLTTTLTRASSTMNLWEFSFTFGASVDNIYLDFPIYDEYGNALFDTNLGAFSDHNSVPCTSTTLTGSSTYSNPECIFLTGGTNAQPARIWIRGFPASTGTHTFIIVGPQNPAALRRLYINARFYYGTTFRTIIRMNAYETVSSSINTQGASGSYQVSSDHYYAYTSTVTTTFTTAVTINSGNYILVKLDSDCTIGSNTGGQYIATGDIGTYVFQKASGAYSTSYTFSNFKCSSNIGLSFVEYHITSITAATGEIRTSNYAITTSLLQSDASVSLSSTYTVSQILSYYQTGSSTQMKVQFNLSPLSSYITSSSYLLITFRDTTNGYYNYLDYVTSCTVLGGLTGTLPDKKVSCDVYSSYSVVIYGVSAVSGDISLLLGGVTYSGSSSGPLVFTLYSDSTRWSAGDYYKRALQYMSLSYGLYSPSYTFSLSGYVSNTIYFDDSNYQTTNFYVAPSSWSYSTTTNSDSITINFDTFDSSKYVFDGNSGCSISGGGGYYASCSVSSGSSQSVTVYLYSGYSYSNLPGVTLILYNTRWRSSPSPYFFRATYYGGNVGTFYASSYTYTFTPSTYPASPFTATPLHYSVGAYTEYAFTISSSVITLDTTKMVSFKYSSLSNRQSSYSQIDCICLQGSSQISASCYNYMYSEYSFDIMFGSTVSFGSSVTCYIPDILNPSSTGTSETLYGRILNRYTRTNYLQQTLSTLYFNSLTSDAHILDIDVSSTVTVGNSATSGSFAVTLDPNSYSYNSGSYLYVDFQKTGLSIPASSDLTLYRVYSTVRNIYVSYLSYSSGTGVVSLFTASQISASSLSSQSADYQPISYISDGTSVVSLATTTISYTMETPTTDITVTVDQALMNLPALMHISFVTGATTFPSTGVLKVTIGGVTNLGTTCYASIGYKEATCSVSSSVLSITYSSDVTSSAAVDVLVRANNPTSSLTVTVNGYSSYTSGSVYSEMLGTSSTLNFPTYASTPTANTVLASSKMTMLSLITKTIASSGSKAPLRIKFQMTSALTADSDIMKVTLPSGQYTASSSTLVCSFRTYTGTFESEFTEKIVSQVIAPTFSSSVITVSPGTTLAANTNHELVCVVSDYTGFTILSAANQKMTVTFSNSGSTSYYATSTFRLYQYQSTPFIQLTNFYFTSKYSSDPNALVFKMLINTALTVYPNRRIEIELPSASSNLIGSGWSSSPRNLPCGFATTSSLFVKRTSSSSSLRCTFVQGTVPKIRIENYKSASASMTNTFSVIIYDLANSVIAQDFVRYFDANIVVTDEAAYTQSRHKWRRGFPLETATSLMQTSTATFPSSGTSAYYTSTTLTRSGITWYEDCLAANCRFLIRALNTDWKFGRASSATAFQISTTTPSATTTQTNGIIIDTVNQIIFVQYTSTNLLTSSGGPYGFKWTNILSPLPYETNGGSYVLEYYSSADGVNAFYRKFTFSGTYPTLSPTTFSVSTASCSTPTSGKNGKVDCSITIPFTSSIYSATTPLQAIEVDFPTASQYSTVYPFCQAYLVSGSQATASKKQLSCSRLDTSSSAGSAKFFITGFTYASGTSNVVFNFKAKGASSTTLATNLYSQVLNSGTYYTVLQRVSYSLSIASSLSTSYFAPSTFSALNYYNQALQASAKKPFRFAFTIASSINAGGSLVVTLSTTTSYAPTANTLLMCTLRDQTTFAAPYITVCSYSAGVYTLKLVDTLPASRYLVELTNLQQDMSSEGMSFPSVTNPATMDRVKVQVQVIDSSSSTVSIDSTYLLYRAPAFSTFSVTQRNKIGSTASQFQIDFSLATAVPSDGTTEYLMYIEFPTSHYDSDLGASSACFALDSNPYYNGITMPTVFGSSFSTGLGSLQYAQLTDNPRVIISGHSGFTTASQNINIAYVKNPTQYKAASMNIYIVRFDLTKTYPVIVYQASYTNYFPALARGTETNTAPTVTFSALNPEQTTSMTFTKDFGTTVYAASSKIYVKLRNLAHGFDYTSMRSGTAVTCTGYTVQWHKDGYIFFLVPSSDVGPTVTVTCYNLKVGYWITDASIEIGIHRENSDLLYDYTVTPTITAFSTSGSSDSISISNIGGTLTNPQSVNLFRIIYNPGTFTVKATSYIKITIPSGFAVIPGVTEKVTTYGFTDYTSGSPAQAVNAYISGSDLIIAGFADFTSPTTVSVSFYLRNAVAGSYNSFALGIYDSTDVLTAYASSLSTTYLTVDGSTPHFVSGSFGPYLTGDVPLYATEIYPIIFAVTTKTSLTYATSGAFKVTLPTGFTQASNPVCKYSTDSGSHWIWSTCSSSVTGSGTEVTFDMLSGFDVTAGVSTLIMLCTDLPDITQVGITRPSTTSTYYIFQVESMLSSVTQESTFIPFILYPMPGTISYFRWYTRGSGDYTVIEFEWTADQQYGSTDFFQIDFVMYDDITQVFANDLGSGTTEKSVISDCARDPLHGIIASTINIDCYITPGQGNPGLATPYIPTKIRIAKANTINTNQNVNFFIAKIKNPTSGIPGGFVLNVMRQCRNDGYGCPIFRKRDYSSFGAYTPKVYSFGSRPILVGNPFLFQTIVDTQYRITTTSPINYYEGLVIMWSTTNVLITNDCTTSDGMCIHFPRIGWTFFQPTSTLSTGINTFDLTMDNAFFYDRTNTLTWTINTYYSSGIYQRIEFYHPDYSLMIPVLDNDATQTDPANQYIVRNFDNILQVSMTNIWRTALTSRIIVNTPPTYATLNASYCHAGVDLSDISNTAYVEFPCMVTGDRQITIIVSEAWVSADTTRTVVVYYRGFESLAMPTGTQTASTITSYASITTNWCIDENTGYTFDVSPTPTPIVRDLNLNHLSFYDRLSKVNEYVVLYTAVWPNTKLSTVLITKMIFQLADEFLYPSLTNLVCITKAVFRENVTCTFKREQGRSLIYVNTPSNYDNGPFLLTITNTAEDLLFIAPDREGSFLFNVTYLDASGNVVETSDSYIAIKGEEITFSAEPILIDPLTPTVMDIKFTTTSRVTPQGYVDSTQESSTQVVILFQTYDPAYPLDLGTGFASGSYISCVAAKGMTVVKKGQLLCQLIIGSVTDHSKIIITNYDAIPVNTDVEIMIDIIPTLDVGIVSRIGFEVDSTYTADTTGASYIFYSSLVVSPTASTASTANAASTLTVTRTGSDTLRSTSDYTFTFTTTAALTAANQDYFVINMPEYSYELNSDYTSVTITISSPSTACEGYVMPKTNNIYIRPTANVAAGSVTLSVQTLQNPSFYLSETVSFTITTIVSSKTTDVFTDSSFSFTSTLCQLFSNVQITYDSTFIRVNENTYKFSFTVDHIVPADGSIAIVFDPNLYKLSPSNPVCELISGFSSSATCGFEVFDEQLVRISMNGVAIESGTAVAVNIIGVNNPTDSTTAPVITIRSYFDDAFATTEEICSVQKTLSKFSPNSLISCPITVLPEVANAGMTTDYLVTINCAAKIRNGTTINIQFPPEYEQLIPDILTCATSGNYLLLPCSQVSGTAQINVFISTPNSREALVIRLRGIQNPALSGSYTSFTTKILQYSVLYAQSDSTSATNIVIKDNFKLTQADDKLVLSILPTNFGEKSTHFFSLRALVMQTVPDNLIMVFDSSYPRELGSNLVCGTFSPNSTFGTSVGLNYETIANYSTFPCTVIDDYKLQLTISSAITIKANTALDFFIFIQNLVNPSLTDQTSFAYKFYFIASGSAVLTAVNTPTINFGLPPSLLHVTSTSVSDSNLLAPAIYTVNMEAMTHLPSAISDISMDYELQVNLPSAQYPAFSQGLQVVYSFPDNTDVQHGSTAFNYFNSIFLTANYPDLYDISPLKLVLSNMSNPDVESYCGFQAPGSPVKFDYQYASRKQNLVYARSYNIMDQYNCLPLGKKRDAIKVIAPYYLRQGLVYNITVSVEEGAAAVSLTPLCTFLLFSPSKISFVDYESSSTTINVIVPTNAPKGRHLIKWKKTETSGYTNYLEVADTEVIVVDQGSSEALTPKPQVTVEDIRYVWVGDARDVLVTLDYAPAENLIVQVNAKYSDTKLKGSVDGGVTFTSFPIYLSFASGQVQNTFYVQAEQDAKDNVFTYSLTGTNAPAYNSKIVNSPFVIKSQVGLSNYQILSTEVDTVLENQANYTLTISGVGTIYYIALVASSTISPTKDQIVSGVLSGVDSQYYTAGKVDVVKRGLPFAYTSTVTISGLESQTKYQVYFIARSAYGEYSGIVSMTFTTRTVNEGVSILIPTFRDASIPNLLDAISMIIPVARSRVIFTEAETFPVEDRTAASLNYGDQLNGYRITIAPDPHNNIPSPLDLANELLTTEKQEQLLALIPQFYPKAGIKITPVRRISPKVIVQPTVDKVRYYTASISVELIEVGRLFAIATEMTSDGMIKPTSYQISKGLMANNVHLDDRYYKTAWTAATGKGTIVFDELKEYTSYNIYITAGNDVPYASLDILKDDETMHVQLQTLKNPNVGSTEDSLKLYSEYIEKSGERIGSVVSAAILSLLVVLYL